MKLNKAKPPTQGHIKTINRINEVFNNEIFQEKLSKIKSIKDHKKRTTRSRKLATEYSLDFSFGSRLFKEVVHPALKDLNQQEYEKDICKIIDAYEQKEEEISMNEATGGIYGLSSNLEQFPIHLALSPYSSKRDLLDFINKNWNIIRFYLDRYDKNLPQIRAKRKTERDEFIWSNRHLPSQQVADLLSEKFPHENLIYSDINKILHQLRKKKRSNLV